MTPVVSRIPLRSRRTTLVTSLALALLCAPLAAQSIANGVVTGRAVDAKTFAPLEKVLVTDQESARSALTDEHGRFELRDLPEGRRQLVISVVGFARAQRTVEVVAGKAVDVVVPLSEGTGTFTTTVTVTGDLFRAADPAVAAQQTLGSVDIQNLRGVLADDPLRAVQVLPGVVTGDDLRSEFSVRGSDFGHLNLTVDGFSTPFLLHTVRAIEDRSASGSVAMINSDILDEVTLLNGGYPQRYGNRTGAEADFRLREGSRERPQARVAVSGTNASAVFEGPLGRSRRGSWLTSVRQSYLNLVVHELRDQGLEFGFSDAQAKFAFDPAPAHRLELTVLTGRSRLQEVRDDLDTSDLFVGRNASTLLIGTWRRTGARGVVTTRLLGAQNHFSNDTTGSVNLDKGHDTQAAARVDAALTVGGAQIESGASVDWIDQSRRRSRFSSALNRYNTINDFSGRAARTGLYGQLHWTHGALLVTPGVRADYWGLNSETTASPWVQAEWKMSPSMALRAGAGLYQQFPDFEQVIGSLASPDPTAERARQIDVGVEKRLGATMRWQVTLYDRKEDGLYRRPGAESRLVNGRVVRGIPSSPYRASLDGFARGVELLLQRRSPNGLAGWVSYSYGQNRYHDTLTNEAFWGDLDQRHTVNVYVLYRVSDRFSVSGKLRAGSNVPAPGYYAAQGDTFVLSATRNDVRLPGYSRIDLRANRTFNWSHRRLTVFAEVMNVLNRENVRFHPPGINTRTGQVSKLFETLIPIIPSAGVLIEF
jgi:hypothetical protein